MPDDHRRVFYAFDEAGENEIRAQGLDINMICGKMNGGPHASKNAVYWLQLLSLTVMPSLIEITPKRTIKRKPYFQLKQSVNIKWKCR